MSILKCARKLTDDSLIYHTELKTIKEKMKRIKRKMDMLRRNDAGQKTLYYKLYNTI